MKYGVIPTNFLERAAAWAGKLPLPLIDVVYGPMKARVIMAGVQLGVFEALRDGSRSARELASLLHLDDECLDLLMRVLVSADYLEQDGDRFRLSALARRTLVDGAAEDMRGYVHWNYTQWEFIEHLEELVRTGRGVDFHETMSDDARWGQYQRAMLEASRLDAATIAAKVRVPAGATRLLDVAGSHGLLGAAICRRHPPMTSTVIDLPQAIDHARALAREAGIADLVEHRAGDILQDDLGGPYDVALLANICHHFTPEKNAALLGEVGRALRSGGTTAIWEIESPRRGDKVGDGDGAALFFRLTSTARSYHGDEYAEWLRGAGFSGVSIVRPMLSPGAVLVTALRA